MLKCLLEAVPRKGLGFIFVPHEEPAAKRHHVTVALMLLSVLPIAVDATVIEKHFYSSTIGSKTTRVEWKLEKQDLLKLTWATTDETVVTWHAPSLATLKCLILRPGEQTRIMVARGENSLTITGELKGKSINKKLKIDHLPWYQALSISLRPFLVSDNDSLEFWTLRLDTLRVYKLKASKSATDFLICNGRTVKTQKVKLRLAGILAFIGESYYWFRIDDGLFMKYAGPATLQKKQQIIVEIIEFTRK